MKTSTRKRIARFAGLLLLALLVVALAVPAAQAKPTLAQLQRAHNGPHAVNPAGGSGPVSAAAVTDGYYSGIGRAAVAQPQTGLAWGYYYSGIGRAAVAQPQTGLAWGYYYSGIGSSTAAGSGPVSAAAATDGWLGMPATAAGSGPVSAAAVTDSWLAMPAAAAGSGPVSAAPPAPSGTSSTTAWIAIGGAVAVLIIALVAWTMIRRRRQPSEPTLSVDCALHPDDSLCRAG